MAIIEVKNLSKDFKVKIKEKGLKGSLKAFIKPKYKIIKAVKNISFEVEEGEMIACSMKKRPDSPHFSTVRLPGFKTGYDAPGAKHTDRTFPCQDPLRIGCAPVQRSILDPHGVLPV